MGVGGRGAGAGFLGQTPKRSDLGEPGRTLPHKACHTKCSGRAGPATRCCGVACPILLRGRRESLQSCNFGATDRLVFGLVGKRPKRGSRLFATVCGETCEKQRCFISMIDVKLGESCPHDCDAAAKKLGYSGAVELLQDLHTEQGRSRIYT